jgi:hypothetical protein
MLCQYPSTTNECTAASLQSAPSAAAQELTVVALMGSSHSTRTVLPSRPGAHVPPDRDMVISIIESVLELIDGNEDEVSKPTRPSSGRGERRQWLFNSKPTRKALLKSYTPRWRTPHRHCIIFIVRSCFLEIPSLSYPKFCTWDWRISGRSLIWFSYYYTCDPLFCREYHLPWCQHLSKQVQSAIIYGYSLLESLEQT